MIKLIIIFLFLYNILYTNEVYTTSLSLKKINVNEVLIKWKSNTNGAKFVIYRNNYSPIENIDILRNSKIIFDQEIIGKKEKNLFLFESFVDKISLSGNYYYIVLPFKTNYNEDDFKPNINYNINPIIMELEEIKTKEKISLDKKEKKIELNYKIYNDNIIDEIVVRVNYNEILLLWTFYGIETNYISNKFSVYRTNEPITSISNILKLKPVYTVYDDYFFEDKIIEPNKKFYYAVIMNDNFILSPGKNFTTEPVMIKDKTAITIEKEYIIERKSKKDLFIYEEN